MIRSRVGPQAAAGLGDRIAHKIFRASPLWTTQTTTRQTGGSAIEIPECMAHGRLCMAHQLPGAASGAVARSSRDLVTVEMLLVAKTSPSAHIRQLAPGFSRRVCCRMTSTQPLHADCPNCGAAYKVVRVERPNTRQVECRSCGGPLPGRQGQFALRYCMDEATTAKAQLSIAKRRVLKRGKPKDYAFDIYRLNGTPAAFIGSVSAPDAETALKRAIADFQIVDPQMRARLMAERRS